MRLPTPLPDPAELRAEQARRKAAFCLATGVQPSEYDRLTNAEIAAFIEVHNERNRGE